MRRGQDMINIKVKMTITYVYKFYVLKLEPCLLNFVTFAFNSDRNLIQSVK